MALPDIAVSRQHADTRLAIMSYLPFHSSALGQKPKVIASSASLSRRSLLSCCAIFSSPFCCAARVSGSKTIFPGTSRAVARSKTGGGRITLVTVRLVPFRCTTMTKKRSKRVERCCRRLKKEQETCRLLQLLINSRSLFFFGLLCLRWRQLGG